MRHVTDGELHAYLDGALDALAEGRGEEVRNHLDSCSACRERLDDERGIREGAQRLLDASAPVEENIPPFEELRLRARALEGSAGDKTPSEDRLSYRGPLRGMPLAWAATVVLALGVGWMGGEIWRAMPGDSPLESQGPPNLPVPGASTEAAEESRARPPADTETADPPTPQGDLAVGAAGAGGEGAGDPRAEAGPPAPREGLTAPHQTSAGRSTTPASAPALRGDAAPALREDRARAVRDEVAPDLLDPVQMARENSLSVPGLKVLSVEWEEWVPGERNLHIRQLLSMGDTLELRYLGLLMGTDPDPDLGGERDKVASGLSGASDPPPLPKAMEASLPPGWNQVVVRRGRGWIVARAPLPEPSLRALVRSLH